MPARSLFHFLGEDGEERAKLKKHAFSGSFGIESTIMHVAQDDIPLGGAGASGIGSYHGVEGFRTMSHGRAVFEQGRSAFRASYIRPSISSPLWCFRPVWESGDQLAERAGKLLQSQRHKNARHCSMPMQDCNSELKLCRVTPR